MICENSKHTYTHTRGYMGFNPVSWTLKYPKKKFLQDLTKKMLVILQDHTRKINKDFGTISGVIMHVLVSKIMVGN